MYAANCTSAAPTSFAVHLQTLAGRHRHRRIPPFATSGGNFRFKAEDHAACEKGEKPRCVHGRDNMLQVHVACTEEKAMFQMRTVIFIEEKKGRWRSPRGHRIRYKDGGEPRDDRGICKAGKQESGAPWWWRGTDGDPVSPPRNACQFRTVIMCTAINQLG